MIVFCAYEQMQTVSEYGKRYGFEKSYPLFFIKNYSAQVLKANIYFQMVDFQIGVTC